MERSLGNQVLGWEIQAQANFEKLGGGKRSENLSFDIDHNMSKNHQCYMSWSMCNNNFSISDFISHFNHQIQFTWDSFTRQPECKCQCQWEFGRIFFFSHSFRWIQRRFESERNGKIFEKKRCIWRESEYVLLLMTIIYIAANPDWTFQFTFRAKVEIRRKKLIW